MNTSITEHPLFEKLDFSQSWIKAGLLSDDSFRMIVQSYNEAEDDAPEHYRWKAFKEFLRQNSFIPEERFWQIYELSLQDNDYAMARAMRFDLLQRGDCPLSLVEKAVNDSDHSLRKYALKQMNIRKS
jgi:hypothetical protein